MEKCGKEVADNICGISFDTTASTPALTDERGVPLALLPEYAENPDAVVSKEMPQILSATSLPHFSNALRTPCSKDSI